ncbi:MAG: alpha/beta hydrolase [Candidatus Dormibacteraeota bacterium]|nr:alpha/beta hydrolase [Candidatus Dormibacteraeota bacterium]
MDLRSQSIGRWYPIPPVWLEGRAWLEYARLQRSSIFAGVGVPAGDGRPVMLIPGFLAGDTSLDTMRGWLRRNGYRTLRSGINLNAQSSEVLLQRIASRLGTEYRRGGRRVSLVGQRRGGVLALGVAQRYPQLVEEVISLGSPIGDPLDVHPSTMAAVHVARLVHAMRRGPRDLDARFDRELADPVPVPVTSMYSKTDGIVHWRACLRPDVASVEVGGSHVGMGINVRVYEEIARVLARPAKRRRAQA